jgi:transposase-like protein
MNCPHCQSKNTYCRSGTTVLGYKRYQCCNCQKRFNERTGTPYNFLQYPTDIVFLILFHYLRYPISYEQVTEMFWLRGFRICAETVRQWVLSFGTFLAKILRKKRRGKAGRSWSVDETYVKVNGVHCYLYRARDKQGELIDVYLSPTRDKASAMKFFESAIEVVGHNPDRVTTDKNPSYPDAIKHVLGKEVKHRTNKYLNNRMEQDHRYFKSKYKPMKTFKDFFCALKFCYIFEEVRNFMRLTNTPQNKINSTDKHWMILSKFHSLEKIFAVC